MPMPGRKYQSSNSYRYGFNGKENDLESGTQDYGLRIYNLALGKFLSVDPLAPKYPELTPYQFASNRPIDGIDLDGLEYATFTIFVSNGRVKDILITKDYELKNKSSKGAGIQYNTVLLDKNGKVIQIDQNFVSSQLYGIYQGKDNPKLPKKGGFAVDVYDNYDLEPIDETDAIAKQHDLDYDKAKLEGFDGVLDPKSTPANERYIKSAEKTLTKYKNKELDNVTGKPVTKQTADAAKFGIIGFKAAEYVKGVKERTEIIKIKPIKLDDAEKK